MMHHSNKSTLLAGIVAGYVLGRLRKAKLAFAVATYVAGRRFGLHPRTMAAEGVRRLRQSPQVTQLSEQVRGELLSAGRTAVSTAANRRIGALADALEARTRAMEKKPETQKPETQTETGKAPEGDTEASRSNP